MEQELGIVKYIWLIPFLPFLAAGLTSLMRKEQRQQSQMLVIGVMSISFLLSCCMLAKVLLHGHGEEVYRKVVNFDWFYSGSSPVQLGFVLDPLSALMLIVVSLVGLVIFIFSIGYMDEDENACRSSPSFRSLPDRCSDW
jgi:NADH-quinone oxidoreductase subunit L